MKPEDVKKALVESKGQVTLVLSDASNLTVERGAWNLIGKTLITKSKGKDQLIPTDKIAKIEPAKQSATTPPPGPAQSRVFQTPRN